VTTFSNINCTTVSVVHSIISVAYAHMVKYSITVIMYLALDLLVDGLIGPTKSILHLENACNVKCGCKCIPSPLDVFSSLLHTSHA
jgi:hypothetical protein